jgi:hypothetical protein
VVTITNVERFVAAVEEYANRGLPNATARVTAQAVILFVDRLVARTPVDKGVARSGYVTTTGAGGESPTIEDPTGSPSKASVRAAVARWGQGERPRRLRVFSTVPYIRRLEYGWSRQAPHGMLRLTVAEWPNMVEAAMALERAHAARKGAPAGTTQGLGE